jgi:tRNA(fMet)-specific endonuclease VapC
VRGYLLDTNIIIAWYDKSRQEHQAVVKRIAALDSESILCMSVISWGEMEYGHRVVSDVELPDQIARNAFVDREVPLSLDVCRTTSIYYGQIRARVFNKYAPREHRKKGLRPEQLTHPVTALELGIQENDLWIAAQALEHNLILASGDKMQRLSEVAADLVVIEDWTAS